jgi:two-component system response regulator FixJ
MLRWPIYIVDDDEAVRGSLAALLAAHNREQVRQFASGDAFIEVCHLLAPGCLLLDIQMPGRNGLEVLRSLSECKTEFATIMFTGQGNITQAVAAMKSGAIDFLEKPYDERTLLDAIAAAGERLDRTTAESARIAAARASIARLSPRELDVLQGLASGDLNKVIAYKLEISPRTVEIHRANLMDKLGARSLPEALRIAFTAGMVPPGLH